MRQDTIENVSWPIKNLKCFYKILYVSETSKCATFIRKIFEVHGGFIGQTILKLRRQEIQPFGPNPAKISIPLP